MDKEQEHNFPVRFPQHVWEQLTQLAQDEERSINWEVIQAVRERIAKQKKDRKSRDQESI